MLPHPDEPTLLRAVARFLETDLRGAITDRGLAFRLRIASHLLATTAAHLEQGEALETRSLADLTDLLETPLPPDLGRREILAELHAELSRRLREGTVDREASLAWLQEALRSQLKLTNPRFVLDAQIEQAD